MGVIGVLKGKMSEIKAGNMFEELMAENVPTLVKNSDLQIQESE